MAHFGLITVGEGLLREGTGPAEIDVGLLDYVPGGFGGKGRDGRTAGDVGEDGAFGTVDFVSKIEASLRGPGQLAVADAAAGEFQNQQGVVLTLRFFIVYQTGAPGHYFDNRVVLAEEKPRGRDAVAAEVVHRTSAGLLHVPEVRAMRPAVGSTLL